MLGITGMRWYFAVALECNSMVVDTLSWRGMVTICQGMRIQHWYYRHERHCLDGPAVKWASSDGINHHVREWYVAGRRHRLDGPAAEYEKNTREWYVRGILHRLDGPAIENPLGKAWYVHGQLHRLDGPAVKRTDGTKEWWIDGVRQF